MLPKGLGNIGDLSNMVKQAMSVKGRMEELKENLAQEKVEAASGGGMVKVVLNGKFELLSIEIEPEVIDKDDPEMLQTLVAAAVNEGNRKVQELVKSKMSEIAGGIDIPGLTF